MRHPALQQGRTLSRLLGALCLSLLLGNAVAYVRSQDAISPEPTAAAVPEPGPAASPEPVAPADPPSDAAGKVQAAGVGDIVPAPALPEGVADGPVEAAADAPVAPPAPAPDAFASFEGVTLVEPSPETLSVGFHEGNPGTEDLQPVGTPIANARGIALPPAGEGANYAIMPSRGRGTPAASAADLALDEGKTVTSVVTGTVLEVAPYTLYGRTPDILITIQPDANPTLRVRMYHVRDPLVAPGQRVVAGETPVAASPRQLPFPSQVDRITGRATPHVHVHVQRG